MQHYSSHEMHLSGLCDQLSSWHSLSELLRERNWPITRCIVCGYQGLSMQFWIYIALTYGPTSELATSNLT